MRYENKKMKIFCRFIQLKFIFQNFPVYYFMTFEVIEGLGLCLRSPEDREHGASAAAAILSPSGLGIYLFFVEKIVFS